MATEIGKLAVRRSILIEAMPERVWQEFTSFEKMKAWFGIGHKLAAYEPRVGGDVVTEFEHEGKQQRTSGKVLVFDPGRELTFESDWEGTDWTGVEWAAPTLVTIRLTPALNGTLVELFHHAIERVGPNAAEQHRGFESGWTTNHLEALREIVEA